MKRTCTLGGTMRVMLLGLLLAMLTLPAQAQSPYKFNMERVGWYDIPGYTTDVEVSGSRAYVLTHDRKNQPQEDLITILDVSKPEQPKELGTYSPRFPLSDIAVSGSTLYLGDWQGLHALDVTNPQAPQEIGSPDGTPISGIEQITIQDQFAYTLGTSTETGYSSKVTAVDLSAPETPQITGILSLETSYNAGMVVSGDHGFLGSWEGMGIIDVSNPADLKTVTNVASLENNAYRGVAALGNYAFYLTSGSLSYGAQLSMINVARPQEPFIVETVNLPGDTTRGLMIQGSHGYVAAGGDGVYVLDLADPTSPDIIRGSFYTAAFANKVVPSGSRIYVASGYRGLEILSYEGADRAIRIFKPNKGDVFYSKDTVKVAWQVNTKEAGNQIRIELWRGDSLVRVLDTRSTDSKRHEKKFDLPKKLAHGDGYYVKVVSTRNPELWDQTTTFRIK